MTIKIVVARYNENIEWTKQFKNVIIYNKGTPLNGYNDIPLQNVGREGHTYYTYIYDNYDKLEDYTIFLQGNPFDHSQNIISTLHEYSNKELNMEFEFLTRYIVPCNLTGCGHHWGLPLKDIYEKIFNERKEELKFKFGSGGQFIVSKKKILQHPKEFYLNIIKLLDHSINPIEGYVVERFHSLIFK